MDEHEVNEKVLSRVDAHRRDFVKRLLAGAAFAAPVLATFSIDALTPQEALAQNVIPSTPEPSTLSLIGTGAVGLGIAAYRHHKRKTDDAPADRDTAGPEGRD